MRIKPQPSGQRLSAETCHLETGEIKLKYRIAYKIKTRSNTASAVGSWPLINPEKKLFQWSEESYQIISYH